MKGGMKGGRGVRVLKHVPSSPNKALRACGRECVCVRARVRACCCNV